MKKLMKRLEDIFAATAFAEAGESETTREILRKEEKPRKTERITPRPRKQLRAPGIER